MVRHVRYSRWRSTPARPPQSLWLPVIHHSGRAKLRLSRTRCPNPQRNCPEHAPSSNRRATDATDPYNLCASVLKKLTRDPASTDLGLESPSYAHSCPFVVQIAPLRLSVSIRVHPWRKKHPGHTTCLRVFASSREAINQAPHPRTPVRGSPDRTPNTENRTCAFPFAPSRLRVSQTACRAPGPHSRGRIELGLERTSYIHSCPFVVQNAPCDYP